MEVHKPSVGLGDGVGPEFGPEHTTYKNTFAVPPALQGPQSLAHAMKCRIYCHEICCLEVHKVLRLPRDLHCKVHIAQPWQGDSQQKHFYMNMKMPKRSFRLRLPPTSENEPHVQKSRLTARATKALHRHKAAHLLHLSQKVYFRPPKRKVSFAHATKSDHQVPKCVRHRSESAVSKSIRSGPADFASPCSRNAVRRSRGE